MRPRATALFFVLLAHAGAWLACDLGDAAAPLEERTGGDAGPVIDATAAPLDAGPQRAAYGLDVRPQNPTCTAPPRPSSAANVKLEQVFATVDTFEPMTLQQPPDDPSRIFVAIRGGKLLSFPKSNPTNPAKIVADLPVVSGLPFSRVGEGGFLGFAFHPAFATNGRVYVYWTTGDGAVGSNVKSRVGFITSSDGGSTFTSYTDVLSFDQPGLGHFGGTVAFGPDGFLYVAFGDGSDVANGQRTTGFFSKMLRIGVDGAAPPAYTIPPTNPFATGGGEPAAFAYGFRNPFRFSFDRATGDLWLADVGLAKWEEIDIVELGGNYGWACLEGTHANPYMVPPCPVAQTSSTVLPLFEYEHPGQFRAVTGGVVYRGKAIPSLVGQYIFGDEITGEIWSLGRDATTGNVKTTLLNDGVTVNPNWVAFSEDLDGEVYGVGLQGKIYKLEPATGGPPLTAFPERLSTTGCFDPSDPRKPSRGLVPYGVNAELWSDGASKQRHLAVPDGATITVTGDGDFDLPAGSVLSKTFVVDGKRVETRLLVRHSDGDWAGYTYEWLEDESDAVLLPSSKQKKIGNTEWRYPARGECMLCHTAAAGRTLGLELGQLNGDFLYESTNRIANQLATLEHIGMFASPLPAAEARPVIPAPSGTAPLDSRARAYLHANCSQCHRPQGGGRGAMDLRFATSFGDTKTCQTSAETGDLGITGAKLLVPGDPSKSLVSVRPRSLGAARMPPLASSRVDETGLGVVDAWIQSMGACP